MPAETEAVDNNALIDNRNMFDNPFHIEDLEVFDDETLHTMLVHSSFGLTLQNLAHSLQGASEALIGRFAALVPEERYSCFEQELRCSLSKTERERARRELLDGLFWELTYWKTPELYEELTEGERLHPGLFPHLEEYLRGRVVLDAGAGSGRALFECQRYGVARIYAVEPSPGLLHILKQKLAGRPGGCSITTLEGRFDKLPLEDNSVDVTISCSAFTAEEEQGGELGLAEMQRVTKPNGRLIIIWPRACDHTWFARHGFQYVSLPIREEMCIHFRSLQSARDCVSRFYAHNKALMQYIQAQHSPEIPFSITGLNPPHDYFWLEVKKGNALWHQMQQRSRQNN